MNSLLKFGAVAFSGSRSCRLAASAVKEVFQFVSTSAAVSVGCSAGVDFQVRTAFPDCKVFRVSDYKKSGSISRSSFAARSVACVKSVCPGGVLIVVPKAGQVCPPFISPKKTWVSCGSGSWSSAALALGLGASVLLWVAPGTPAPRWAALHKVEGWNSSEGWEWWLLKPKEEIKKGVQKELF